MIAGSVVVAADEHGGATEGAGEHRHGGTASGSTGPGGTAPGSTGPGGTAPGYDETSGITYEVQPRGFEILGLTGTPHEGASAPTPQAPPSGPHAAGGTSAETRDSAPGPVFNQTMASAPQPVQEERESRDHPFGKIFGRRDDGGEDGDGGEPVMTRFRDLPLDQKLRIWRLRALIIIIVGVVFTIIANWQVGISLAIIAGIADTIYRARGVEAPGHIAAPGTIDRATVRAQKRTIRQLASMERSGYYALNRRPIPGSTEVIDHLVIGPTGVYAIDSEKWDKDMPIRTRNGKQLWLGPESKKERLEHARWEAGQASEQLSAKLGTEIKVQATLAIYGPKIPWDIASIKDVDVFSGDRLKKYLRRRAKRKGVPHLSSEQITKIRQAAGDVLPQEWRNTRTPVG